MKTVYTILAVAIALSGALLVGGYQVLLNTKYTAIALAMVMTGTLTFKPLLVLLGIALLYNILKKITGKTNDRRNNYSNSSYGGKAREDL